MDEKAERIELKALDRDGQAHTAPVPPQGDVVAAEDAIRREGGRVVAAEVQWSRRPAGISAEDFARFNEQLASAVQRGVPLLQGVRRLGREMGGRRFHGSIAQVEQRLERGDSLRDAFAAEQTGFPPLYGRLLEAGAAAEDLPQVLLALARNIRTDATFRAGIVEAVVYPALLLVVCLGFLAGFAATILPGRFVPVAEAVEMRIPAITELMAGEAQIGRTAIALAVVLLLTGWLFWRLARREGWARDIRESVLRRLPLYRSMHEAALWSSAADTLALLLRARVPAPAALRLTGPATDSPWVERCFADLAGQAEAGQLLPEAARRTEELPRRVVRALDAGAARNDLPGALIDLGADYRDEAQRRARNLVTYLPPAMALVMGVLVLLVALSVFLPVIKFWGAAW